MSHAGEVTRTEAMREKKISVVSGQQVCQYYWNTETEGVRKDEIISGSWPETYH